MIRERESFRLGVTSWDWSQGHLIPPPGWHGAGEGTGQGLRCLKYNTSVSYNGGVRAAQDRATNALPGTRSCA